MVELDFTLSLSGLAVRLIVSASPPSRQALRVGIAEPNKRQNQEGSSGDRPGARK